MPTVAETLEQGQRLAMVCPDCGRFKYLRPERYAPDESLAAISRSLTCARCLSPEVRAVSVSRNLANGFWPAEQG